MRYLVYAIAAAIIALALALVRRVRGGGRRRGQSSPGAPVRRQLARHTPAVLQSDTALVARREIRERLRGRLFKVVTILLLLIVGAAIVIPTIHSSKRPAMTIGVVGGISASGKHEVLSVSKAAGVDPRLVEERDSATARNALRAHHVTAVVVDGASLLADASVPAGSTTAKDKALRAAASALGIERAFSAAGLSPTQARAVASASPLPITDIGAAAGNGAVQSTSLIGLILIFVMLTQYCTWTLMGIMEEKSSRVVEVLLATVRPRQLLGGKLLGIGTLALVQGLLVVGFALIVADVVGSDLLRGTAPLVVVASLVWLVLGYAFYSWLYAAAGSMAERQDQVQSLALPLSAPIIFGYVVALTNAGAGSPSLLLKVLAYLPPTAPFGMPLLVGKGAVTWWEFAIAVLLSVAGTLGVARVAAAIYRRAILRTGRRLRLSEVLATSH